ncbi:putative transmembrane family 234 protein [Helianthus anomalus]
MVIGDIEKMVTVGLIWGATNALMRRGALISDQQLQNKQASTKNPILKTLIDWFNLILVWQYSVPFFINLSASATFFAILSDTPISIAVPVTNATTFAATAVFGMLLGEETRVGLTLFGTFFIVLGVYVCVV